MKAFILVLIPVIAAYFYLTYKLIVASDFAIIFNQTASQAQHDLSGYGEDILKELKQCYSIVLSLIGASAVVSFIWILLLKYNAKIIVWISIFSLPVFISVGLYYSVAQYIQLVRSSDHSLSHRDDSSEDIESSNIYEDQTQGFERAIQTILKGELLSFLRNDTLWLVISILLGILLVLLVIILHTLRKRVRLAIALIRQASKAINGIKSTLFFPIIPRAVGICVLIYGIIIALLIITAGHPTYKIVNGFNEGQSCNPKTFNKTSVDTTYLKPNELHAQPLTIESPSKQTWTNIEDRLPPTSNSPPLLQHNNNYIASSRPKCVKHSLIPREHTWKYHAFNLFVTLWLMHFISGISQTTLAGAFASYYWAYRKPEDVPFFAVTLSFIRVIKYHLGDIAFGSFLMATIRYIRIIIEFITNRFRRRSNQTPAAENVVGAATAARNAGCFLRVFFWIIDRFLKYIDRNAYIMMSMYGEGYLESAKRAIKLLYKNSTRAFVLDYVTYFVLLVSRLLITGLAGYAAAQQAMSLELKYKWLPIALTVIGSYFISKGLFSVYSMAVDTLFICFLIDSNHNDGSAERPYFMPKDLRRIMKRTMKK